MDSPPTDSDHADIPEVTLVFEDDPPGGGARSAHTGPQGRSGEAASVHRDGADVGHHLPQGRVAPAALGVVLGAVAVLGILVVNLAPAFSLAGVTTAADLGAPAAVAALARLATTVFGPLCAVAVTLGAALLLARRGLRMGGGPVRALMGSRRSVAFLSVMVTAWMLEGLVATVTAGTVPFVVQASAFAAALAAGLTVTAPRESRLATGLVSAAVVVAVSVALVLAGFSTLVAGVGSVVVGVVSVLLGAAAWNRWFAPALEARDALRRTRSAGW
jgi:hypothetical protein